jgi:hypothetical protein
VTLVIFGEEFTSSVLLFLLLERGEMTATHFNKKKIFGKSKGRRVFKYFRKIFNETTKVMEKGKRKMII